MLGEEEGKELGRIFVIFVDLVLGEIVGGDEETFEGLFVGMIEGLTLGLVEGITVGSKVAVKDGSSEETSVGISVGEKLEI